MTMGPNVELPAGDPARRLAGRATAGTLGLALLFILFNWSAKKVPGLYQHEPWQDDPFDALVSLSIFWVPLMAVLCLTRVLLWRRSAPQPVRRVRELMQASVVLLAVMTTTLTSDWVSVLFRVHRASWTGATAVTVTGLAVVSLASLAVARELRRAWRLPFPKSEVADGPDWLSDMITLGEREAARLGPLRPAATRVVRLADRYAAAAIRRQPLLVAAGLALMFGSSTSLAQGLREGYAFNVFLVLFINQVASMFAYLAITGAFLGIAGTPSRQRAAKRSPAGRRRAVHAGIAACVSIPIAGAFRAELWSLLGLPGSRSRADDLIMLMLAAATVGAALTYTTEAIMERTGRWRPTRPQP